MNFKSKAILMGVLSGAILVAGLYSFSLLKAASMKPCILSLQAPIVDLFSNGDPVSNQLTPDWRMLTPQESQKLISGLVKNGKTDCGTIKSMADGNDYWGHSVRIEIRKSISNKVDVKVLSLGPDGDENTADDISLEAHATTK